MAHTDPIAVAERINKSINFKEVNSREDYIREYNQVLDKWLQENPKNTGADSLRSFADVAYLNTDAKDKVDANKKKASLEIEELKAKAIRFEQQRERFSRIRDERKTAKDTRNITKRSYSWWKRGGFSSGDLRGVDTKQARSVGGARGLGGVRGRQVKITNADRRLQNYRPFINLTTRQKSYRSVSSGRWTKNPYRSRK